MNRRIAKIVLGLTAAAATIAAVACIDMSAPAGPASISLLKVPELFIVRGDVMRDSLGAVAVPTVTSFDANGKQIATAGAQFFITDADSLRVAHFDPATGALVGDKLGIVHVIGQVGDVQTPALTISVSVAPETLAVGTLPTPATPPSLVDSSSSLAFSTVQVIMKGVGDTTIAGAIVMFSIVHAPPTIANHPLSVFLADDAGNPSIVDTTDGSGSASRRVGVIGSLLGSTTDSVIVQVSAKYKGVALIGSPLRVTVPIKLPF